MLSLTTKLLSLITASIFISSATGNYTLAFMFFISSITLANIYYTLSVKNELIDLKMKIVSKR